MTTKTKNVPKLRFPEFDGEWEREKLGNLATFFKGKGISKDDIDPNGDLNCIRYGELYTHYGETIDKTISKTSVNINDTFLSQKNDVIIPASGESAIDIARAACVLNAGIALGGDLNILRSPLNGVFLSYYLNNAKKQEIAKFSQGISVIHLYATQLKLLNLFYPIIKEQQKIVDFLSSVDNKIQNLKQKQQLLQQYKKGMMQKLFSQEIRFKDENGKVYPEWNSCNLNSIAKVSIGLVTTMTTNYVKIGIPLIRNSDILQNSVCQTKLIQLSPSFAEKYKNKQLQKNDIVTVHTGDVGVSSVIPEELNGALGFATLNTRINSLQKIDPHYLAYYFNTHRFRNWCLSVSTGDGRCNLNLKDFENARIIYPVYNEQQKIANCLSAIDQKIELVAKQIEQAELFKKGLLQQLFV